MSGLSTDRLIEGLLAGVAAGSGGRGASFGARMAVCAAFAVLALVAAGFLIAAAYMALAQALPPAMAAALVGAAALLLAGLLALGLWVYDRARRRRTHAHGAGDAAGAQGLALLEIVADEVRDHPQAAALAALVAGAVVGANPQLQDRALHMLAGVGTERAGPS